MCLHAVDRENLYLYLFDTQTLPHLHSSYVPEGLAQVEILRKSELSIHMASYLCIHKEV